MSNAHDRRRRCVAHVLDFVPDGKRSMEMFLVRLAERLKRERGLESVFVFAGPPGPYFQAEAERLNAICLQAGFPLSMRAAILLGLRLRCYCPSVVTTAYTSKFSLATFLLQRASGASRLVIQDRSSGLASPKAGLKRLAAVVRGFVVGRCVDRVIAVSHFVRRRDIKDVHLPPERVEVIWNGVDVDRFAQKEDRHRVEVDAGPTIVYAGQLAAAKGVLTLLQAVQQLEAEGRHFRLLVAGAGPQEEELRTFCKDCGLRSVTFLGQVFDMRNLIASADVVVVPSEWEEAFGLIVAEAMAAGTCVLGSDAGAIPELLVGEEETAGVVFRRGDVDDLRDRLGALLDDPTRRERLGAVAQIRASRLFSIDRAVSQYINVLVRTA